MTTHPAPDALAGLCERLRAKARASFEANKSFGRRGKEWAIETEPEWQAVAAIERLVAGNERMREAGQKLFRAFSNPMVRRQLGGHDEQQMEAILFWREATTRTALQGASDDR